MILSRFSHHFLDVIGSYLQALFLSVLPMKSATSEHLKTLHHAVQRKVCLVVKTCELTELTAVATRQHLQFNNVGTTLNNQPSLFITAKMISSPHWSRESMSPIIISHQAIATMIATFVSHSRYEPWLFTIILTMVSPWFHGFQNGFQHGLTILMPPLDALLHHPKPFLPPATLGPLRAG